MKYILIDPRSGLYIFVNPRIADLPGIRRHLMSGDDPDSLTGHDGVLVCRNGELFWDRCIKVIRL